jgi:hypothetical protein
LIGAGVRAATAIMVCGERRAVCGERTCEFFRADGASSQRSQVRRDGGGRRCVGVVSSVSIANFAVP